MPIRNQSDIAAVEAVPLSERALPESSYAALVDASKRSPDAQALSFFLSADRLDEAHVWTYAELVADVTRAANVFAALGVAVDRPVAYVLPNLPDTHFAIWGGEAAGAALAVNPMLEPRQVADILRFARASILVTLAPALNPKAWSGLANELASLPDLSAIAFVDMRDYLDGERRGAVRASIEEAAAGSQLKVVNLREAMREQPSDRLVPPRTIEADDISSYFCTGGTTGAPKIAVRTHRNEVFDCWAVSKATETDGSLETVLCGLPLFHVNGQLVTGLQPWMRGDRVVIATPEGYRGKNVVARFWEIVSRYRVTMFSGVPTLYSALMQTPVGDSLVHGAAGGLGTLALQTLSEWGARVTAIARASDLPACLEAGAAKAVERERNPFANLRGALTRRSTSPRGTMRRTCFRACARAHLVTPPPSIL